MLVTALVACGGLVCYVWAIGCVGFWLARFGGGLISCGVVAWGLVVPVGAFVVGFGLWLASCSIL